MFWRSDKKSDAKSGSSSWSSGWATSTTATDGAAGKTTDFAQYLGEGFVAEGPDLGRGEKGDSVLNGKERRSHVLC